MRKIKQILRRLRPHKHKWVPYSSYMDRDPITGDYYRLHAWRCMVCGRIQYGTMKGRKSKRRKG